MSWGSEAPGSCNEIRLVRSFRSTPVRGGGGEEQEEPGGARLRQEDTEARRSRRRQEQAGGCMRSHERSQEGPGRGRRSQAEAGGGRSQAEPGRDRRSQEEPGGARRGQEVSQELNLSTVSGYTVVLPWTEAAIFPPECLPPPDPTCRFGEGGCRQIKVETLASHTAALGCWLVRVSRVRCRIRSCLLCRVC